MLGIDDEGSLAAGGTGGLCEAKDDMFRTGCLPSLIVEAGNSTICRPLMRHVTGVGHREPQDISILFAVIRKGDEQVSRTGLYILY